MTSRSSTTPRDHNDEARPDRSRAFVLWHETVIAYAAPAALAGTAALLRRQSELGVAAPTSIAGTSALVAALVGWWLQRHGAANPRIAGTTRRRFVATWAIAAATAGLAIAAVVAGLLPSVLGLRHAPWLDRTWLDLPLSAGISTAIVTWRWRSATYARSPLPATVE
jgi:hypothetical protein